MRLRNAVLAGGISGLTLFGADCASASYTTFELRPDFLAGSSFERIGATAEYQQTADRD